MFFLRDFSGIRLLGLSKARWPEIPTWYRTAHEDSGHTTPVEVGQRITPSEREKRYFKIAIIHSSVLVIAVVVIAVLLWNRGEPKILYVPASILAWAFIGAVVAVLHRAAYKTVHTKPLIQLTAYVIAKPVIGTVMGALVYFLAVSGMLALNRDSQISNTQLLCVVAFIGGFSDKLSIDQIDRLVGKLGSQHEKEEDHTKKEQERHV